MGYVKAVALPSRSKSEVGPFTASTVGAALTAVAARKITIERVVNCILVVWVGGLLILKGKAWQV